MPSDQSSDNKSRRPGDPCHGSPDNQASDESALPNLLSLMKTNLPAKLVDVLETTGRVAAAMWSRAYLVGGTVRDLLLGAKSLDLDVVIEGDAMAVAEKVASLSDHKAVFNRKFETATIQFGGGFHIDVARARAERYEAPGALPVVWPATIQEDLKRRDFTINSLAVSLQPGRLGELLDPYNGLADIRSGVIRVLHENSFVDDPTRILRGIKYSNRFGFRFDETTRQHAAAAIANGCIRTLSPHRLTDELRLLFVEERVWGGIKSLAGFGVISSLSDDLVLSPDARKTLSRIERLEAKLAERLGAEYRKWLLRLMLFFGSVSDAKLPSVLRFFDLDKRETEVLKALVGHREEAWRRLRRAGKMSRSELFGLFSALPVETALFLSASHSEPDSSRVFELYCSELRDVRLEITGRDLLTIGVLEGPLCGKVLREVLLAKLDGKVSGQQEELALAARVAAKLQQAAQEGC